MRRSDGPTGFFQAKQDRVFTNHTGGFHMSRITLVARCLGAAALGLGIAAAAVVSASAADDVAQFYKGKRIKIIVGAGPGGGYDTYGRMLGRHIGRYIPGNPSIIVQDMNGAGSVVAANFIVNVAPKDGTVIGGLQREVALVQLLGQPGPKYKAKDFQWLGSLASEAGVCGVATRTGIKSFEDVFKRQFTMGSTGPNTTEFDPAMINALLGGQFKLIMGYPSTPPVHLAIERGEVDGVCQSWASFKEQSTQMLKEGKIKPIVQIAFTPDPELAKMGVPNLFDFITPAHVQPGYTTADVDNYFRIAHAGNVMGRPFAVVTGVPEARVEALRKAFVETTKDTKFLADAKKSRRDVELVTGKEIQDIIGKIAATAPEKLAKVNDLMKFHGKTEKAVVKLVRDSGKVVAVKKGGRGVTISSHGNKLKASISGSKTKVMVDGKKAKRSAIKVGMTCELNYYGSGTQAKEVTCKN